MTASYRQRTRRPDLKLISNFAQVDWEEKVMRLVWAAYVRASLPATVIREGKLLYDSQPVPA